MTTVNEVELLRHLDRFFDHLPKNERFDGFSQVSVVNPINATITRVHYGADETPGCREPAKDFYTITAATFTAVLSRNGAMALPGEMVSGSISPAEGAPSSAQIVDDMLDQFHAAGLAKGEGTHGS